MSLWICQLEKTSRRHEIWIQPSKSIPISSSSPSLNGSLVLTTVLLGYYLNSSPTLLTFLSSLLQSHLVPSDGTIKPGSIPLFHPNLRRCFACLVYFLSIHLPTLLHYFLISFHPSFWLGLQHSCCIPPKITCRYLLLGELAMANWKYILSVVNPQRRV